MPKRRILQILNSLSLKIFLVFLLILVILVTLNNMFFSRMQMQILENTVKLSAYRVGDLIKRSLQPMMLSNERKNLFQTIEIIGSEPGVERIRIYNKKGEITFSSKSTETGHSVDMKAEACNACHALDQPIQSLPSQEKTRIYRNQDGSRILGMIHPIRNDPECYNDACHAHSPDQTILGVLDVQMSLQELDLAFNKGRDLAFLFYVLFISLALVLTALLIYFFLYAPIRKLKHGTEALANGSLDHRINLERKDELGILAESFNSMAANLQKAYNELKAWSSELEKRVQQKSEELERMHHGMIRIEKMASLGKMAATVAHELNNPLAGVVTYAKLLHKKIQRHKAIVPDSGEILDNLELIRSESMRCGNIVRDLLIFARESSAKFQPHHLHNIANHALTVVAHHLELGRVEAITTFKTSRDEIICDASQLEQALVALFVNAVEAMPGGGRLEVVVDHKPDLSDSWMTIQVRDTGSGIPEDIREKIFEPFYTTKNDKRGMGLGLAVVYGIVQRHYGKISVESETGTGTTFIIDLPVDPTKLMK